MGAQLWQLLDSAFPAGGYTRSGGLESAAAMEGLSGEAGLGRFLELALLQAAGSGLPLVNAAWDEPEDLEALNELAEASLPNPVACEASRAQGRALLEAARQVFGPKTLPGASPKAAQHAPVAGALLRALGCSREDARRVFLFWVLRDATSAAVRLGQVGAYAAQRLQHQLGPALEAQVRASEPWGPEDLAQQAPLMDLWQAGHARLERRLFQS